mgnify:CR=1 FL=1
MHSLEDYFIPSCTTNKQTHSNYFSANLITATQNLNLERVFELTVSYNVTA